MTDFNALPLAEQLKALQAGDELHLRGGGWLPFVEYDNKASQQIIVGNSVWWDIDGWPFRGSSDALQIIRVVRPGERKVPKVVAKLRNQINAMCGEADIAQLTNCILIIADHFERGETP